MAYHTRTKSLRHTLRKLSGPILNHKFTTISLEQPYTECHKEDSSILGLSLTALTFDSLSEYRKSLRRKRSAPCASQLGASSINETSSFLIEESSTIYIPNGLRKHKSSRPSFRINSSVSKKLRNSLTSRKANYKPDSPPIVKNQTDPQSIGGVFPEHRIYNLSSSINNHTLKRKPKRHFIRNLRRSSTWKAKSKRKLIQSKSAPIFSSKQELKTIKNCYSSNDVRDGLSTNQKGVLFGNLLEDICDESEFPPNSIFKLLVELCNRGPQEDGLFRKSANARLVRELKTTLDQNDELFSTDEIPICAIGSLLKDFLRSLPDCLFCKNFYDDWLKILSLSDKKEKIRAVQHICSCIPGSHRILMKFFLYMLHVIALNSDKNRMTSLNLALCVGPSVLNKGVAGLDYSNQVSEVISFMIDNFSSIFGENEIASLDNLFLFKEIKTESPNYEYTHQFLSEENRTSSISLSRDSGISSGCSLSNYSSEENLFGPLTPMLCQSRDSLFPFDVADSNKENCTKESFQRDENVVDSSGKAICTKESFQRNVDVADSNKEICTKKLSNCSSEKNLSRPLNQISCDSRDPVFLFDIVNSNKEMNTKCFQGNVYVVDSSDKKNCAKQSFQRNVDVVDNKIEICTREKFHTAINVLDNNKEICTKESLQKYVDVVNSKEICTKVSFQGNVDVVDSSNKGIYAIISFQTNVDVVDSSKEDCSKECFQTNNVADNKNICTKESFQRDDDVFNNNKENCVKDIFQRNDWKRKRVKVKKNPSNRLMRVHIPELLNDESLYYV